MSIKVGGQTVINEYRAFLDIQNAEGYYDSLHGVAHSVGTVVDFTKPIMTKTLASNTTFSSSNVAAGRSNVMILDVGADAYTPTFPSSFKWMNGTEPSWSGTRLWLIGFVCWDSTTIRATATGWGGTDTLGAVDLPNGPYSVYASSSTLSGNCNARILTSAAGQIFGRGSGTQSGGNVYSSGLGGTGHDWLISGSASDYEVMMTDSYVTNNGGSDQSDSAYDTWLNMGTQREWEVYDGSTSITNPGYRVGGTLSIRLAASPNTVLKTVGVTLSAHHSP